MPNGLMLYGHSYSDYEQQLLERDLRLDNLEKQLAQQKSQNNYIKNTQIYDMYDK